MITRSEDIILLEEYLKRGQRNGIFSEKELKAFKDMLEDVKDSLKNTTTHFNNVADFLKQYEKQNDREEGDIYELTKVNKQLRDLLEKLKQAEADIASLKEKKEELETYKTGRDNVINEYRNNISRRWNLRGIENKEKSISDEIKSKNDELEKYREEIERLRQEIDTKKSNRGYTGDLEKERNNLLIQEGILKEKVDALADRKKELEEQHNKLSEEISRSEELIKNWGDKVGVTVQNTTTAKEAAKKLGDEFNKLGGETALTDTTNQLDAVLQNKQEIVDKTKEQLVLEEKIKDKVYAAGKKYDEIVYALRDAWRWLKNTYSYWEKTEDKIYKMARTAGMSAEQAKNLTSQQLVNTKELAGVYGTTNEAIQDMKQSYMEATERAAYFTDENVEYMTAMSKMFGKETVNNMLVGLDKVGVSITDTGDIMFMAQQRAKALGLHAGKSTEAIAKNLDKLNKYNFRNGVDGLTRMVLKTQELKTSMDAVMGVTDKFDTIEDSLKNAAGLQMLGGGFASVASNPMGMMYKAWSDPEALFDDVVKAVGGLATMDKNTGEMKINPVDMHRIKAAADAMGISAQELTNIAKQESRRKIIDAELSKRNQLSKDKDKRAIEEAYIKNKSYFDSETKQNVINIIKENGEIEKKAITAVTAEEIAQNQALDINEENAFKDIRAIREHLTGPISDQLKEQAKKTASAAELKDGFIDGVKAASADWLSTPFQWFKNLILKPLGSLVSTLPSWVIGIASLGTAVVGPMIGRKLFGHNGAIRKSFARNYAKGGWTYKASQKLNPKNWFKGKATSTQAPSAGGSSASSAGGSTVSSAGGSSASSTGTAKPRTRNIRVRKGNGGTGMTVRYRRPTPARGRVTPPGSSGFKFKGGGGKGMIAMAALMIGSQLLSSKQSQEEKPTSNISSANTNVSEGECSICELVKLAIERNELLSALAGVRRTEEKQEEIQEEEESIASKAGNTVMTAAYLAGEKTTASVTSKAVSSIAGKTVGQMAGKVAGTVLKGAMKGSLYSMAGDLLNQGLVAGGVIEEGGHINKLLNIGTRAAEWGAYGSVIPGVGTTIGATAGAIYEALNQYRDSDVVNYILGKRTSKEERAALKQQSDFETGKIGYTDITDPALMEKAAMATIGIHDLLITKWNREEGKRDDGTEKGMIEEYVDNMSNNFEKIPIVGKPIADANKWVYDKISNFFGEENGGIIPEKAEKGLLVSKGGSDTIEGMMENTASSVMSSIGAMIPGDSYTGDKVHVMANSGEMILNKAEQKSLFELLKSGGKSGMLGVAGLISSSLFGKKEGGNVKNPISSILDSVGNFVFGDNNVEDKDSILSKILFAVNKIAGIETPNANGMVSDTIKETNESKFNEIIVRKLNNDNISSLYTETVKPSEPIGSVPSNVSQYRETMIYGGGNTTVSDINVNISGTIRLEGANGGVGIDFNELMNNAEFRRQIVEMVKERLNTQGTGGKMNKESMSYNTSMMYNRT